MNLRWLVKQDGTRVLQVWTMSFDGAQSFPGFFRKETAAWTDIPEVREPEKDPIMAGEENSA